MNALDIFNEIKCAEDAFIMIMKLLDNKIAEPIKSSRHNPYAESSFKCKDNKGICFVLGKNIINPNWLISFEIFNIETGIPENQSPEFEFIDPLAIFRKFEAVLNRKNSLIT
ncbi:MAG: hypothetical protein KA318_00100 [Nitrosomonas sp.]|nr:hypothetical protein [Nitrosomonas sp.]